MLLPQLLAQLPLQVMLRLLSGGGTRRITYKIHTDLVMTKCLSLQLKSKIFSLKLLYMNHMENTQFHCYLTTADYMISRIFLANFQIKVWHYTQT